MMYILCHPVIIKGQPALHTGINHKHVVHVDVSAVAIPKILSIQRETETKKVLKKQTNKVRWSRKFRRVEAKVP